ncbi:MAG: ABC-F family ATP-binding cassette domain-containing protein [Caldilineaceae bacterium]|nr:ABC-F family ATP-binding cassette domain-containing protein [Caldilineaceae bacterium]
MSILTISNLTQSYGDFDVFVGLNAAVPNDGKIGLVGPNGIGKTTLLRILAGLDAPSAGAMTLSRGSRIGYLRQEAMDAFAGRENTVHAEMLTVFNDIKRQEAALREMEHQMAEGDDSAEMLARYSAAQEVFEHAGGYDYELRIRQVLQGLGFGADELETPLSHLSGGQKTRALLARLLLERPDLLILDEPTNHLDVEAVEWLEGVLRLWEGALLIVSHDRYFLDRVVNRIWEMSRTGMEEYRGNYSHYVLQRQERWALREQEFETIREKFLRELDYVKRNIARDATTNMAKGRLQRLIREVKVVEAGGLSLLNSKNWGQVMDEVDISSSKWSVMDTEQHIRALSSPIVRPPSLNLRLHTRLRSGNLVLRSTELTIGFPNAPLFAADPLDLHRGECAALIGPNGTGKTTFLRTLMGQMEPLGGKLQFGASLKIGYLAQSQDKFNPENSVLDELLDHKHMLLGEARSYLAQYLFRGEDVFKSVRMLSGGERARLALAILALEGANFLLLDEPSNHLDIPAQEILQEVLEHFDGTILLVSHDRYLIDQLATQIWELREGRLHITPHSYQEYLSLREAQQAQAAAEAAEQRSARNGDYRSDRTARYEERRRAQQIAALEDEIHRLEQKLSEIEADLVKASHSEDIDALQRLSAQYESTQATLNAQMETWTELAAA